jgi:hypothetical protein
MDESCERESLSHERHNVDFLRRARTHEHRRQDVFYQTIQFDMLNLQTSRDLRKSNNKRLGRLSDLGDRSERGGRASTEFHDIEAHSGSMQRNIGELWAALPPAQ